MPERPAEPLLVWALFVLVAVEILVTYSRLPARELYNVSGSGLEAGLSRALVFANFPTALAAIGVLGAVAPRLAPRLRPLALVAGVLCAAVAWPGMVRESDLDARPVNAIAATGVAVALALTLVVCRPARPRLGRWRLLAVGVLLVIALPWEAADLGFFLPGSIFLTGAHVSGSPLAAVHHGHHHGMDGVLLVVTALLLSRLRPAPLLAAYLALMTSYGLAQIANDGWLEQVVKRGWSDDPLPDMLEPTLSVGWLAIVLAAVALTLRRSQRRYPS
jgi:hypothetical protein